MTTLYQSGKPVKQQVPDPSDSYERSHPEHEAGMGRLDKPETPTHDHPDSVGDAVGNAQELRQLNAEDVVNNRAASNPVESVDDAKRRGTEHK
jgi:hypothetical protein